VPKIEATKATRLRLRSRHHKTFLTGIAAFAISLVALSCTERERVAENEEEAVFMLVAGPVSEGDYNLAITRADSILASPREMSDSLRAYIMIERDNAISEYGHLDWGAAYADTVIAFGKTHDVPLAVTQGLMNRGITHRRKGNYDKAISDYKSGMAMAVEAKDTEMEQTFADMLAIACAETNLNDEAMKFAQRSLELSQEAGDITGELNSISTIGGILAKQGRHQEAISTLLPYHATASQTKSLLRVKYLTPLLKSYLSLDSLDMVHKTLAETYEALDGVPRNTQAYLVAVNTEAELAAKEGRYADQWKWLLRADTIGGMGTSPEVLLGMRARCLANMGKFADAYEME
ncbi:MAG: hypothetical protein K2K37_12520, partial [Muribaculaceae bacterium]|nr:hypothetical protein [Muribaculaceae bacterium]